jgi:uncharacterized membrane protein YfcA
MLLSACNQLLSLGTLRKEVVLRDTAEREGALAYIAGGIVGAPIGLGLLQTLPPRTFTGGLGLFLIVYSVLVLAQAPQAADQGVGLEASCGRGRCWRHHRRVFRFPRVDAGGLSGAARRE